MQKNQINNNMINYFGVLAAVHVMAAHTWVTSPEGILKNIIMPAPAVAVMFGISGFLCAAAYERTNGYVEFITKRFLRIYPVLILAVVIPSLIYSINDWEMYEFIPFEYFKFIIRRIVFCANPDWVPEGAEGNVSIWTIVFQVQFYLLTPVCMKLLKQRKRFYEILVILFFIMINVFAWTPQIDNKWLELFFYKACFPYLYMYLIGVYIYVEKENVLPILVKYSYLLMIIYIILEYLVGIEFLFEWNYVCPLSACLAICTVIGLSFRFGHRSLRINPQYGIYLWHMR